jgi:AGCS family alanine or glycine:cation symporter
MLMDNIFNMLEKLDAFYWSYIGIYLVVLSGIYFTIKSKFYQLRILGSFKENIANIYSSSDNANIKGLSPLRLYFASVGGMIGLGNVVAVTSALLIGGPGALFWLWVTAIFGMLIKYSEIYLGIKYRVENNDGGYHGGSIYYLQHAFKTKGVSIVAAILLGIYGVEVYQFAIVSDNLTKIISTIYPIDKIFIVTMLMALVLYSSFGGIKRLANICSGLMPIFIIVYILVCLYIVFMNITAVPAMFLLVIKSAFFGHAPIGGFVGSTMLMAAQQGIAKAVYSGDIGIGYDSIIQSETKITDPMKQANMAIFASTTDAIICTMSIMVALLTGAWQNVGVDPGECVAQALSSHLPISFVNIFMSGLILVAGYTTIIAYLAVGVKCALYINPKFGYRLYLLYAGCSFLFFSFYDPTELLILMSLSGGALVLFNIIGILKLRKEIRFN